MESSPLPRKRRIPVPNGSGIGLRAPHYAEVLERRPALAFVEVHAENFFGAGGAPLAWLARVREAYPLSLHGVALSLGSADPIDEAHLARLEALVDRFEPELVSDHLCWGAIDGRHANDLLPLPHTDEALDHVVERVQRVQERLGRRILVENVASYVEFACSTMGEAQFLREVARRSGCGVLLDVSNIVVSAHNHGFDPRAYLETIDPSSVGEIHLAGCETRDGLLVDTHGDRVGEDAWSLYGFALERFGPRPTLVEWDVDLPALDVLLGEARRAQAMLDALARKARASEACSG